MPARTRATVRNHRPVRTGQPPRARQRTGARRPPRRTARGPEPSAGRWVHRRPGVLALGAARPRRGNRPGGAAAAPGPPVVTSAMPGSFTGYAFDTCEAPSQRQMDAWREHSPYAAVGIYIAGENRGLPPPATPRRGMGRHAGGPRLAAAAVERRAPGAMQRGHAWSKVDPSPTARYAAARGQGREVATDAAAAARDLGIARGSTLWLDVESFDISRTRCRDATLAYVSSWTRALRRPGTGRGVLLQRLHRHPDARPGAARQHPGRTTCRNRSGWATGTSGTTPVGACGQRRVAARAGPPVQRQPPGDVRRRHPEGRQQLHGRRPRHGRPGRPHAVPEESRLPDAPGGRPVTKRPGARVPPGATAPAAERHVLEVLLLDRADRHGVPAAPGSGRPG